jgi:hypothetical protein
VSNPDLHGRSQTFQNRSFVTNSGKRLVQPYTAPSTPNQEQVEHSSDENLSTQHRGVAKYGRGAKAWISEDALRRKLERRKQFVNSARTSGKDFTKEQVTPNSETSSPSPGYITIDDIPFQVTNGGSKLRRTTGRSMSFSTTYKHSI